MPQLYVASEEGYQFIKNLNYGFYMEVSDDNEVALLLKLEPGLINSIISGCELKLTIRNPHLFPRSCTLYIFDNKKDLLFVTAKELGQEDTNLKGFDQSTVSLADGRNEVIIVLYNEINSPVFTANIGIVPDLQAFEKWLFKIYNDPAYRDFEGFKIGNGDFTPESQVKGFEVQFLNVDHSNKEMLSIYSPDYEGQEITGALSGDGHFRQSDFRDHGKHGRLQELALDAKLTTLFKLGENLFSSPKYDNKLEMIDFIVLDKNAAILIESKYIVSEKKTKRNDNIVKAINQLNRAESEIYSKVLNMENEYLNKRLMEIDVILKVCVINDKVYLDDAYASQLSKRFDKEELPLFISVTVLSDLLVGLNLKNPEYLSHNLFSNLINIHKQYIAGDQPINYHHGFNIGGLNAFELTELGKLNK